MHGRTSEKLLYKYKYIHPEFHKAHINSVLQQKYNDQISVKQRIQLYF